MSTDEQERDQARFRERASKQWDEAIRREKRMLDQKAETQDNFEGDKADQYERQLREQEHEDSLPTPKGGMLGAWLQHWDKVYEKRDYQAALKDAKQAETAVQLEEAKLNKKVHELRGDHAQSSEDTEKIVHLANQLRQNGRGVSAADIAAADPPDERVLPSFDSSVGEDQQEAAQRRRRQEDDDDEAHARAGVPPGLELPSYNSDDHYDHYVPETDWERQQDAEAMQQAAHKHLKPYQIEELKRSAGQYYTKDGGRTQHGVIKTLRRSGGGRGDGAADGDADADADADADGLQDMEKRQGRRHSFSLVPWLGAGQDEPHYVDPINKAYSTQHHLKGMMVDYEAEHHHKSSPWLDHFTNSFSAGGSMF